MLTLAYHSDNGDEQLITLDATASEQHVHKVRITSHPIERGGNPVDHVVLLPAGLRVDGVFSDFPLAAANGGTTVIGGGAGDGRAQYLLEQLRALQEAATVFEVRTGVKVYSDMLLEEIGQPRDKSISAAARFTLGFTFARFVDSQTVAITKPATNAGKPKVTGGKQTGKEASEGQKKRVSLLKQSLQGLAALSVK